MAKKKNHANTNVRRMCALKQIPIIDKFLVEVKIPLGRSTR